ncbi:MAG: TRAP transporter substrate-binding protein DctP [Spirochaetales bacterium]|nr:TRAP transporter substrate-binding protein DctP [Spirochaetales bacterium]
MKGPARAMVPLLLVAAVGTVLFAGGVEEEPGVYTMKLSHAGPVSDVNDDYVGASAIKEYIEAASEGRIVVEIYSGSQLGNYQEVMEQVDSGTLEVAHTSIGGVTPFIPELAVVDLQYLIPGDEVVEELMAGPFFDEMSDAVAGVLPNVRLVGVSDGGRWRSFYTTGRPILTAADLAGLRIRTISSPLQQEFTRQLGAAATPVAWGEVYTALASELVVGLKIATPDIMSNNFDEVIRYGTLDRHTFLFGFYFIGEAWLASLPAELQRTVLDGIAHGAAEQTTFNRSREDEANAEFVAGGGRIHELTEAERETFMPARTAMMEWYRDRYGNRWLDSFLEAIELAEARLDR